MDSSKDNNVRNEQKEEADKREQATTGEHRISKTYVSKQTSLITRERSQKKLSTLLGPQKGRLTVNASGPGDPH